jgi:hypothetical protein
MPLPQFPSVRSLARSLSTASHSAAAFIVFVLISCAVTGWTIAKGQERSAESADDQSPRFASLPGQRAAISIDPTLTPEDLATIIESDPRATQCSDALIRAQWQQDIARPLQASAHFDSCEIDASLQYLKTEYESADSAASSGDVFSALRHLGHVLHSVVDFYAHTNFVELSAKRWPRFSEVRTPILWDRSIDAVLNEFKPELLSGRAFGAKLLGSSRCREDGPTHSAMNKDSPTSERGSTLIPGWGMTHYRATFELTKASGLKLLRDTLKRPSWSAIVKQCGTTYGFALHADVREEQRVHQ